MPKSKCAVELCLANLERERRTTKCNRAAFAKLVKFSVEQYSHADEDTFLDMDSEVMQCYIFCFSCFNIYISLNPLDLGGARICNLQEIL